MSLFKVCNWWKTQCPDVKANYDSFSIHCTRLCIEEGEKDSILVGSHAGYFSIYQPSHKASVDSAMMEAEEDPHFDNTFQHSDVILEIKLNLPVIGITSGKFTTASKTDTKIHVAILHPAKICIYQILTIDGIADHGDHTRLHLLYEHILNKPAFSFCRGAFGGVKGRDFLCVQHLDGSLRFYEQDGISYEVKLPGERNIPSPVLYVPRVDCFVTVSPAWELECYRYQDLSETNESVRRSEPIWSMCVGEYALDLNVHQVSNGESVIMVLGENNFLCVTDTGKVKFIKKLDYSPICFYSFVIGWYWEPDVRLMVAVVSENGSLLLYEGNQIVWSTELPEIPVAVSRANVSGLPGALVTLGSTGLLSVDYLGSEPHLFKVPPLNLGQFEIEKCQKEMVELEKEIRSGVDFSDIAVINAASERDVALQALINPKLEKCSYKTNISGSDSQLTMCQIIVSTKTRINLELLQICMAPDPAIKCNPTTFMFRDVAAESSLRLETWIYPFQPITPSSLNVKICCSFTNKQGITRVVQKTVTIPLSMFVKTCQASKEAVHKVTLTVHESNEGLAKLFPEFISEGSPHALGLLSLITGSKVTIVAAKNTNRYRVQSEDLYAIPLIVSALVERIYRRNPDSSKQSLKVSISSNPPIDGVLEAIDKHYHLREQYKKVAEQLEVHTGQMRLFERRFVVKLQERSLRALDGIQMLLKKNHTEISKICSEMKAIQSKICISQMQLSAMLSLMESCFVYSDIPTKYLDTIKSLFTSPIFDSAEQSWEEMMQPAVRFLSQNGPLKVGTAIATFDEKYIFSVDESFRLDPFKKQLVALYARIGEKRSKTGRSSADFEEELEELDGEQREDNGGSEWIDAGAHSGLPFQK